MDDPAAPHGFVYAVLDADSMEVHVFAYEELAWLYKDKHTDCIVTEEPILTEPLDS
jgi:hypothetical protein